MNGAFFILQKLIVRLTSTTQHINLLNFRINKKKSNTKLVLDKSFEPMEGLEPTTC